MLTTEQWAEFAREQLSKLDPDLRLHGGFGMLRAMMTECGLDDPTIEDVRAVVKVIDEMREKPF